MDLRGVESRKASLLAGGDGRAVQQVTVSVPMNRFHLVSVDTEGAARLKLQPRYDLNADRDVIRHDTPPAHDAPPSVDDLLTEAARNHQLERAHQVERAEARHKQRDSALKPTRRSRNGSSRIQPFEPLSTPKRHPRRCYLQKGRRKVVFDAKQDRTWLDRCHQKRTDARSLEPRWCRNSGRKCPGHH